MPFTKNKRVLAAILVIAVIASIFTISTYALINTQRSNQTSSMLSLAYLYFTKNLRIVSQAPSITEIIFGLGLGEYLVGCTKYCDYPPELLSMTSSGRVNNSLDWYNPSLEAVMNLNPTVVLLDSGISSHVQLAKNLQAQGVTTFLLNRGTSISEIQVAIYQLATFLSSYIGLRSTEAAQRLVDAMNNKINWVKEKVSGQTTIKVLLCIWLDIEHNTIWSSGKPTFINDIIEKAGGINVYSNLNEAWIQDNLNLEKAASKDPDVIIILDHHALLNPSDVLSQMASTPLANTPAYKNNRVFFLQGQADNLFARPGPRVAEAVELLAHILFPDVFNSSFPDPHVINDTNYKNYLSSLILESSVAHASKPFSSQSSSFHLCSPTLQCRSSPLLSPFFLWRVA